MKKFIALILILIIPLCAFADKGSSPYVADEANVIGEAAQRYIDTQNAILEKACGARIIVVTTREMNRMTLSKYSEFLASSYKLNSGTHTPNNRRKSHSSVCLVLLTLLSIPLGYAGLLWFVSRLFDNFDNV